MREFVDFRYLGKNPARMTRFFRLSSGFTVEVDEFERITGHSKIYEHFKEEA